MEKPLPKLPPQQHERPRFPLLGRQDSSVSTTSTSHPTHPKPIEHINLKHIQHQPQISDINRVDSTYGEVVDPHSGRGTAGTQISSQARQESLEGGQGRQRP